MSHPVLKGAAASALYGSRAANGVILITLGSGASDQKPVINFTHPLLTRYGRSPSEDLGAG
ncbi:MAG: hypothetical protein R2758_05975 [Bacteroidales bacterium]